MKILLNGKPAAVDDLRHLVSTNYGHFTVLRVEEIRGEAAEFPTALQLAPQAVRSFPAARETDVGGQSSTVHSWRGGVRGLDLHLDRLQQATRELFGTDLDRDRVRGYLRDAIAGETTELSVRINVFSCALDRERLDKPVEADVLLTIMQASQRSVSPLRVKSFRYSRDVAAIKHVGTFSLFHHRRLAQQAGFDDAVFADEHDRISEGSIWNVGFVDHDGGVVWPDAPQLDGVSMQLLKNGLARDGRAGSTRRIELGELAAFRSAFFTNASVPVRPIASIDGHAFAVEEEVTERLLRCYESNPPQPI